MALIGLIVFLDRNGLWLFANDNELFEMTIYVAKSDARETEMVLNELRLFVNARLWPTRSFEKYFRDLNRNPDIAPKMPRRPKRRGEKFKGFPRVPSDVR